MKADTHGIEPRIPRCFVGEEENDVHFFKRAEGGFGVEPVYEGNDGQVGDSEDDPGAISDVGECNWGYKDDAVRQLVLVASQGS